MLPVLKIIQDAISEYRKSGARLTLPFYERTSSPSDYLRPSSLGLCALQSAYEKHGIIPDFPEKTISADSNKGWITNHGNYVAPMIQEPLMWYALTHDDTAFQPEFSLLGEWKGFKVSGRLDGLLTQGNQQCVIEIKNSEGKAARSKGEPQLRYVWQTLLYMSLLKIPQGAIIIANKWGYDVWDLVHDGGDKFILLEDNGKPYRTPYGVNWNENVTLAGLEAVLTESQWYNATVGEGIIPKPPIQDPLNNSMGWLCVKQWERPTKTKEGRMEPACPFAGRCHNLHKMRYNTVKIDDKIIIKD